MPTQYMYMPRHRALRPIPWPLPLVERLSDGPDVLLHMPVFTVRSLARSCAGSDWEALRRKSGPRVVALPAHRGCTTQWICGLGRPHGAFAAICEVLRGHTARAHAATAVLSDRLRLLTSCAASCFVARGSSAGQSRRKKRPPQSRQRATWLSACPRREMRPSSSTRQANKVGRVSRRASRI
jgi:hypothetical protein